MKYLSKTPFSFGWNKKYEEGYNNIFHKSIKEKIKEFIDSILIYLFLK
jgi:hypothetical protein